MVSCRRWGRLAKRANGVHEFCKRSRRREGQTGGSSPEGECLAHVYQRAEAHEAPRSQLTHQRHLAIWLIGMIRAQMADRIGQEEQAENWEHHGSQDAPASQLAQPACSHL